MKHWGIVNRRVGTLVQTLLSLHLRLEVVSSADPDWPAALQDLLQHRGSLVSAQMVLVMLGHPIAHR